MIQINNLLITGLLCLVIFAGASASTISIGDLTIPAVGETGETNLILDSAPEGLSGYTLTITTDNSNVATVVSATFPDWVQLSDMELTSSGYQIKGIDLEDKLTAGASGIVLATLQVKGVSDGSVTLNVIPGQMDDDGGDAITVTSTPGTVKVGAGSVIAATPTPTPMPTTSVPTEVPTGVPQPVPTDNNIVQPTPVPTTSVPTEVPTGVPQPVPTDNNTVQPTPMPTNPAQSGQMTIKLLQGWNFIGISQQPADGYNTAAIFSLVPSGGHSVFRYNTTSGWKTVEAGEILEPMSAYWVYTTSPLEIPVKTIACTTNSRSLDKGWNTFAIKGTNSVQAFKALSSVDWIYVIMFDNATQRYSQTIINGNASAEEAADSLLPGTGYWVYLNNPGVITS